MTADSGDLLTTERTTL